MKKPSIEISRMGVPQVKKSCLREIIKMFVYVAVAIIFCILFFYSFKYLELYIRNIYSVKPYNEANTATWISSVASYWGGIIGGAVSGMISLGGTFIIINYYRKSDISNRQISNQPFLNIKLLDNYSNKPANLNDFLHLCDIGKGDRIIYTHIELKNVGKSFARTGVYYNGSNFGGNAFQYIVEAGETLEKKVLIGIKYSKQDVEASLGIMFFDCFMNEYIQVFNFKVDGNTKSVNVEADYPNLTQSAFK